MGPALKVTSCDWLKFGPSVDIGFWCLDDQGKKPGPKLRNPLLTVDTFGDGPFSIALGPMHLVPTHRIGPSTEWDQCITKGPITILCNQV